MSDYRAYVNLSYSMAIEMWLLLSLLPSQIDVLLA